MDEDGDEQCGWSHFLMRIQLIIIDFSSLVGWFFASFCSQFCTIDLKLDPKNIT